MKFIIIILFLSLQSIYTYGQWAESGLDLKTTFSNVILNSSNQSTATLWFGPYNTGTSTRAHYYIKAYDYWGPYLHFQGTGDGGNEKMNVTVDGSFGVGTTSPSTKLMVVHDALSDGIKVTTNDSYENTAKMQILYGYNSASANRNAALELGRNIDDAGSYKWRLLASSGHTWGNIPTFSIQNLIGGVYNTRFYISNDGNIGIGTSDTKGDMFHVTTGGQYFRVADWGIGITDSQWRNTLVLSNKYNFHEIYNNDGKPLILQNSNGGYVGIGTTNPTHTLTVNGKIKAEEIIVADVDGADFVFEPDYQLPSLQETEDFIKANKHLPGVPSAKQMQEDGLTIGEMNIMLLQKIEELTLYTLKQQKELEMLKKENKVLAANSQKFEAQGREIEELKAMLKTLMEEKD